MFDENFRKYFIFRLGQQLFGTLAIEVREVTEVIEPQWVPKMVPFFKGIINVRGEVIGLIDLRQRLGITPKQTRCYLVFDTAKGSIATAIDVGVTMVNMQETEVSREHHEIANIPKEFVTGTVKHGEETVILLQLGAMLTQEEFVDVHSLHATL